MKQLWIVAPSRTHPTGGQQIPDLALSDEECIEAFNSGPFEPVMPEAVEAAAGKVPAKYLWHLAVMTRDEALRARLAELPGAKFDRQQLPAVSVSVKEQEPDAQREGQTKEVTRNRTLAQLAARRSYLGLQA